MSKFFSCPARLQFVYKHHLRVYIFIRINFCVEFHKLIFSYSYSSTCSRWILQKNLFSSRIGSSCICLFICLLYPVSLVCAKLSSADRYVYVLVRCTNIKESTSHTQCNEARRILDLWQLLPSYGESFYLAAVVCCSLCVMTALFIPASTKQGFPKDKFGPSNARPVCGCSVHKTLLF